MNVTDLFFERLLSGWLIETTTCACGGCYAWMRPKPYGAHEMVGCICHTPLDEKEEHAL